MDTSAFSVALDHPAHLIVGNREAVREYAHRVLMQLWCPTACTVCRICLNIRQEQHHNLLWLHPSNYFTKEDLAPLFSTIAFSLDPDQQFFFVLDSADLLTQSTANSLLKSLEEPPTGYHFLLLAQRLETIPVTIRSRCIITHLHQQTDAFCTHPLYLLFTASHKSSALDVLQILEQPITEQETTELLDALILFWSARYSNSIKLAEEELLVKKKVMLLTDQLQKLPMPGSSKLFWKNLFLQMF